MGLVFAAVPLAAALLSGRPSFIVAAYLAACIGPHHRVAILASFATGLVMLGIVLWRNRGHLGAFISDAIRNRSFGLVLAISGYLTAVWLLRLGDSTDAWSLFALSASMLTVPFAVYSLSYLVWTDSEARSAVRCVASLGGAVVCTVLVYPMLVGQYGQYGVAFYTIQKAFGAYIPFPFALGWVNPDFNTATLRSAHYASIIATFFSFGCIVFAVLSRRRMLPLLAAVCGLFAAGLGENGHALPGMILAACAVPGAILLNSVWRPAATAAALLGMTVATSVLLVFAVYAWTPYYSRMPKAAFYNASLDYAFRHPGRLLLGEGPAAFSSHAARKRLPQDLTDDLDFPFLPRHVNPPYAAVLGAANGPDKYTTLNRPISGLLGLVMEWGLAGTALVFVVLHRLLRGALNTWAQHRHPLRRSAALTAAAALVILFVSLVFRPYFEYPDVMAAAGVLFRRPLLRLH
ncbi:MAG: hypothetical protein IPP94_09265 [Ignavibacteria bacterium]|nr:hypothetical protein [Ignavibacteria bacterium]